MFGTLSETLRLDLGKKFDLRASTIVVYMDFVWWTGILHTWHLECQVISPSHENLFHPISGRG